MQKPKKTRKQKILTSQKKQTKIEYSYDSESATQHKKVERPGVKATVDAFFTYKTTLIYKDLFKTAVISFILITLLVIISVYRPH